MYINIEHLELVLVCFIISFVIIMIIFLIGWLRVPKEAQMFDDETQMNEQHHSLKM